jgi:outer membrane receptor protein involved in Fe transport
MSKGRWHDFEKSITLVPVLAFLVTLAAMRPSGSEVLAAEPRTVEVYVWAEPPTSAATEQTRWAKDLELRPTTTPSDVMRLVPGLIIGQHHGGGKADQILFRGFDSDHGTDFAVFVDGIPVNLVSHAHGQGYADLHWLIPETIERVEIYKGPYFAHLGDFATSGAMNIVTKRRDKDSSLTLSGGRFNTQRYLGILSPPEGTPWTPYLAFEAYHNDGPFKNPNDYNRFNLFAKLTPWSTANSNLTLLATFFKTYWNASGEIPARAVRAGTIGRFDSIDPSEGGKSERQNLSLTYNYADARQALTAQTWASWYRLNLFSNFTFFLDDPVNGDGIEQADGRFLVGNNIHYRRNYTLGGLPMETLLGFQSRFDHIRVGLFRQRQRRRLQTTTDNRIDQTNLGYFLQQELRPTSWLRAQIGARLDSFFFDVEVDGDPAAPISGKASRSIVNPKLNLIFSPFADTPWRQNTRLFLNFGGGFHSNDARVFVQDLKKRIPRYLGGEIGVRSRFLEKLELSLAYWRGHLESELVFAGDAGTFEPKGRSRRRGLEGELRWEILPWLTYDLDLSYTWAEFDTGEAVPLAPRFFSYTGLTARHPSGLQGRLQLRHVGRRYAIEDRSFKTPRQTLADLFLKYAWRRWEFFLSFENLANARWRSAEHVFESRLAGEPAPVLDSHFTPGDPFTVKAGVTLSFW